MRSRLPLVLSITALVVSVLGATPLGRAGIEAAVPLARRAYLADTAKNAVRLNNIKANRTPTAGMIVPLGADGRFPASVGVAGPQGPAGPKGDTGKKGDTGPSGVVRAFTKVEPSNGIYSPIGTSTRTVATMSLPAGRYALFGRVLIANATSLPRPASFYAFCTLNAEGDSDYFQIRGSNDEIIPGTMSVIHEFARPGEATIRCSVSNVQVDKTTWARARITAIEVVSSSISVGSGGTKSPGG